MKQQTIAFIGAGNMAASLIGGLIADNYAPDKLWASNPHPEKLAGLQKRFGIQATPDNLVAAEKADVLVIAVKPQVAKLVALELSERIQRHKPLIISIVTGVTIASFTRLFGGESLGGELPIVRCMPNTPALVRNGATAMFANPYVSSEQSELAESILRAVGITVWLEKEAQLDIVTALSGSGPAYYFYVMQALEQAAVQLGLPPDTAHLLTIQTAIGAGHLALQSDLDLATLRAQVSPPGGTTAAALEVLENKALAPILQEAVNAAARRARELAELA